MTRMIELKTAGLIGPALDYTVAYRLNGEPVFFDAFGARMLGRSIIKEVIDGNIRPSTDWSQGGKILDAHCKSFGCVQDATDGNWRAFGYGNGKAFDPGRQMRLASGPSILIAACRAIVAAHFGDTVKVPAELVNTWNTTSEQ